MSGARGGEKASGGGGGRESESDRRRVRMVLAAFRPKRRADAGLAFRRSAADAKGMNNINIVTKT
jgi:hypothetical protein